MENLVCKRRDNAALHKTKLFMGQSVAVPGGRTSALLPTSALELSAVKRSKPLAAYCQVKSEVKFLTQLEAF